MFPEPQQCPLQVAHDADTVFGEAFAGSTDFEVWRAAQATGRFFITQDLDFSDVRTYQPGTHQGYFGGSSSSPQPARAR